MFKFKDVNINMNGNDSHTISYEDHQSRPEDYMTHYNDFFEEDLNTVVRNIISDSYGNRNISTPTNTLPVNHVNIEYTEEYKDENRPLKDIMTDIVTDVFLNGEHSLFNFMFIISNMFNDALEIYKKYKSLHENDIFFILKGGNVLRMIAKNFLFDLPGGTINILLDYYKNFFKRSDADFSILDFL